MKAKIITSWDDGHPLDLKTAKLLKKYKIPAIFYIPINYSGEKVLSPNQIKELAKDFEIGSHTLNHSRLTEVSLDLAEKEINEGKKELEKIINRQVDSFCYPVGLYSSKIVNLVKKAGFKNARTIDLFKLRSKNPFKTGGTIQARNHSLKTYLREIILNFEPRFSIFMLRNGLLKKDWSDLAIISLKYALKHGGTWHLWGHSWEIDKNNDWEKLEKVFKEINKYV